MPNKPKKIIAVILARGKSKRLPKKNIKLLAGKPLIVYSIIAAKKNKYINRIIVSTEDKEIAEISKRYGAEVIKRPKELASDTANAMDSILHVLNYLKKENYFPDIVIDLQPTSPLRDAEDIKKAVNIFLKNKCDSLISVYEMIPSPFWSFEIEKKYLKPIFGFDYFNKRSQDLKKTYNPNGAIYISTPKNLLKYKSFYCGEMFPYIMPLKRSIDVDDENDFKMAEAILKNKK
jgi:N-acylneuraminate cytidylyltransferase